MKKIILYLFVFSCVCFSQDNFWEQTNGPYGVGAAPIAIDSNGNIYVGKDGILRSTDNGYSWITINNGLNNLDSHLITSITFNSNGYIFITTRDGIYRTTNNGEEWIRVTNGIPCYYSINCIKINSMGCIFAGTDDCGIYSSTDNGDNWVAVSNGIGQNTAVLSLLINSNDIIFSGTTKGALRSTDNGNSWIEINNGFNYADIYVQCLGINPSGDIIAATDQEYSDQLTMVIIGLVLTILFLLILLINIGV